MNTSELFKKIQRIQTQLMQGLIEREQIIKLALLAALSGEHILLIGPPGTGKSLVARRIHLVFKETAYFERLLTRFSVPEELFGPLSIQALEQDQYTRLTQGYLPQASIAFLDEIFKANSAILNALLTLLNEREFDNGVIREKTPLISVIGASNELPDGEELDALYDRFLFRQYVEPVSKSGFKQLLILNDSVGDLDVEQLQVDELAFIQSESKKVELSAEIIQFLIELRKWCAENQIRVSDRRWRKIVSMLKVSAFTNGQSQVTIWDSWLVQHCIWEKPEQIELVANMYEQYCGKSVVNLQNLLTVVDVLEKEYQRQESQAFEEKIQSIKNDVQIVSCPDIGVDKATVAELLVRIGDSISENDSLLLLESDKASVEVPSTVAGVVKRILVNSGDSVAEGSHLFEIELINSNQKHIEDDGLIDIKAPIFPESVADGNIAMWRVGMGDKVEKDQVICDIETDKVVLEVVAPSDGIIYTIIKDAGYRVRSNEKIAVLEIKQQNQDRFISKNSSRKSILASPNFSALSW